MKNMQEAPNELSNLLPRTGPGYLHVSQQKSSAGAKNNIPTNRETSRKRSLSCDRVDGSQKKRVKLEKQRIPSGREGHRGKEEESGKNGCHNVNNIRENPSSDSFSDSHGVHTPDNSSPLLKHSETTSNHVVKHTAVYEVDVPGAEATTLDKELMIARFVLDYVTAKP